MALWFWTQRPLSPYHSPTAGKGQKCGVRVPTEHEREEGVVAQQQQDTEHSTEAVTRGTLLQLQQPIILGTRSRVSMAMGGIPGTWGPEPRSAAQAVPPSLSSLLA